MDECKPLKLGGGERGWDRHTVTAAACYASLAAVAIGHGLTLVHFSAQLEGFLWDRGCA